MKMKMKAFVILGFLGLSAAPLHAAGEYRVARRIPIPGDGGWDYLTIDPAARRLYIAHGTQVQVFDLDRGHLIGAIPNVAGVHGVALSADKGFASNGRDESVTIFDPKTFREISRIKVGENPDAILYDDASHRVFTFNGKSNDMTAIDASTAHIDGRLALGGKPEFAVSDGSGTIFDDLEDKSQLLAIDSKTLAITQRWALAPCERPSSVAMDRAHRRLFVGCGNRLMAVVNADTGRVIMTLPIGDHVDATVFDSGTSRIFNANGDGTLTVIQEETPDVYHVVENVKTQKGARTIALDPQTHRLYLVTAQFGPAPAPTAQQPRPRPAILPGTMILLVVEPSK